MCCDLCMIFGRSIISITVIWLCPSFMHVAYYYLWFYAHFDPIKLTRRFEVTMQLSYFQVGIAWLFIWNQWEVQQLVVVHLINGLARAGHRRRRQPLCLCAVRVYQILTLPCHLQTWKSFLPNSNPYLQHLFSLLLVFFDKSINTIRLCSVLLLTCLTKICFHGLGCTPIARMNDTPTARLGLIRCVSCPIHSIDAYERIVVHIFYALMYYSAVLIWLNT